MSSKMQAVLEFLLQHWPVHRPPLQGASPEDIARLGAAQQRPLPMDYVILLRQVGHGTYGLRWEHVDFRVDSILRFLARMGDNLPLILGRYMFIGRDLTESNFEFLLDLEQASADGTAVVRSGLFHLEKDELLPEDVAPDATSLAEMIFRAAFLDFRKETLPHVSLHAAKEFTGTREERGQVEAVLAELGLRRHPLSGPWFQAYEEDEGTVAVRWNEGSTLQLITASADQDWLPKMGKELRSRLPLFIV